MTRLSDMDRPLVDGESGFLHRLVERGMCVTGAGQVFRRPAELHQYGRLGNHGAGVGADNVYAEHAVGRPVGENLDETFGGAVDLGAAVGGEGELADLVVDAGVLQLLLGLTDRRDLRSGIDHARDHLVVHVSRLAREDLGESNTFLLGLVGQHWALDDIANGVNAGDIRRELLIDNDPSLIVCLHADIRQEAFGVGNAADSDHHIVRFYSLVYASYQRLKNELEGAALGVDADNFGAKLEDELLLGQHALKLLRHLRVEARSHTIEHLDHGHLRT